MPKVSLKLSSDVLSIDDMERIMHASVIVMCSANVTVIWHAKG